MRGEVTLPAAALFGFLAVLARVAGAFVFVPIPGVRSGPRMARAVFALAFTMALFPLWPAVTHEPGPAELARWMFSEAALGLSVGLAVAFLTEALLMCAQLVGLQAGYSYASSIDPNTQADAGLLQVLAQLAGGMLFFTLGLHREVLRVLAHSLAVFPPGEFAVNRHAAETMMALAGNLFPLGLRLALPVLALLLLTDLALALLGRINAQLQLLSSAFPAKMLLGLVMMALLMAAFPRIYRAYAGQALTAVRTVIGR